MHSGKSYKLLIISILPVLLYQLAGIKWIALPWTVVALLGTATAFIVGFKNTQTYNRTWEARQIWGAILNISRAWGTMSRDFISNNEKSKELVYRHFAWLTALRYAMRDSRAWETTNKAHNEEYKAYYSIPEKETSLEDELKKYLSEDELKYILTTKNKAAQLLSLQSKATKQLFDNKEIEDYRFVEMQKAIKDFFDQQGRSERIKNFPYPRQFATINSFSLSYSVCFCLSGCLKNLTN
jgi:ion channel-forming bestrophin family protein